MRPIMIDSIKVSIVAPVYNIERYLPVFIDSVLGQTFRAWELLLVDDGSTDCSGKICDRYAKKDKRIKVIHKTNGGVSSARNAGLHEIKGEWVLMPDPDDELPLDSLETLFNKTSDDVDLLSASYVLYRNEELIAPRRPSVDLDLNRNEFVSLMGVIPQPRNLDRRCCNKLFRASIIKDFGVFFPEDLHYREDILYNYLFLSHVDRKVRCLSNDMYVYYRRNSGAAISNQRDYSPKSGGMFLAMTRCYDLLEHMDASLETKNRMKNEILESYKTVIKLIDKSAVGTREKRFYTKKLICYFNKWELCSIGLKSFYHRIKKGITRFF